MPGTSDESSGFVFRMWRRAGGSSRWLPAPALSVRLDDGVPEPLDRLSWSTADGAACSLAFAPGMAGSRGHRRTADGAVVEVRGELDTHQGPGATGADAHGCAFETETEDAADGWLPAGRLRVLVEDGTRAPLRRVEWVTSSGDARSVTLRESGTDLDHLVTEVRASAEHPRAGEVAENLVRASTAKWFAARDRASVEFRLSEPVAVDHYLLTSANDAPDRDPAAWTLRGAAGGRRWRTLDARSAQSFDHRHQTRTYGITEPAPCDRYLLEITENHGSPHLQLETISFRAGSGGDLVGYQHRAGREPVGYRGTRIAQGDRTSGAEMVEPYGGGTGIRFMIRNVDIDGRGDVVHVAHGGSYQVGFDLLHDCRECGNAVNQVIVGLAGEDRAQASVWNGKQRSGGGLRVVNQGTEVEALAEDNPGPAEWVRVQCTIVVPDEPGSHPVRTRYAQAYQGRLMTEAGRAVSQPEYPSTLGWWRVDRSDGPGPESTIGTIVVEG